MRWNKRLIKNLIIIYVFVFILFETIMMILSGDVLKSLVISIEVLAASIVSSALLNYSIRFWYVNVSESMGKFGAYFFLIGMTIGIVTFIYFNREKGAETFSIIPIMISIILISLYQIDFMNKNSAKTIKDERRQRKKEVDEKKTVI